MEKEQLIQEIRQYFAKGYGDKVDISQLPLNGGLISYLGIDSMNSLEVLIDMENLFNIEITDDILNFKLIDNIEYMADTFSNLLCKKS
ncbi:acyl carrier protein [Candidatus Protochlamydia sp. W-9]|uniref:acyl carrier protein n=1 Tax=Candidatus Protochlamydia sp. W-9 TaxID=1785087 RepID=UPI00096A3FAC|nr:phosphopantetheine-binding protein [Candidatus Protochlamydia sp. W-9]